MKSFKLLLLLGLLTVTGCKEEVEDNTNNQETPATTDTTRDESKEVNNSTNNTSNNAEENNNSSNNNEKNNNENVDDNNSTTENNENIEGNNTNSNEDSTTTNEEGTSYTVSFVNPSCGTAGTDNLNTVLKEYLNSTVKKGFVTEVKNVSSQIANDIPIKDTNTLIIGAQSKAGCLEIFFSTPIKKFTITAQTYHKPYIETWNGDREVANVDSNSVLAVTGDAKIPVSFIDLKSEDEQPIEKTIEFKDFNCDKLHLYSASDENGRVFVKEIKFVL